MSPIRTFAAFAVATAATTLSLSWPTDTHADGTSPLVQYMVDGAKVGDVVLQGRLVADKTVKSGWVVVVIARNPADHVESIPLETDLRRTSGNIASRVMPRPQTIWSTKESVTIAARGTMTKRYELPADIAALVTAAKPTGAHPGPPLAAAPMLAFSVAFQQQALSSARATPPNAMVK